MLHFHQNGIVTVLHRLGPPNLERLEEELRRHAMINPIALVLPSLYSELERPAIKIVENLQKIPYLNEVVVSLDRASALEFRLAKDFFASLPQRVRLIWNDGPRIQDLLQLLVLQKASTSARREKAGAVRASFGYILARRQSKVIALQDCDVSSFNREYLARLCFPLANPSLGYEFCKAYYSRVTDRLHGRVTRLYFTPLIRSLQHIVGPQALLTFLDSFGTLSQESLRWFEISHGLTGFRGIGLEVGVLAEVYRNCALRRICQADIADSYEHKHQILSAEDETAGLLRCA